MTPTSQAKIVAQPKIVDPSQLQQPVTSTAAYSQQEATDPILLEHLFQQGTFQQEEQPAARNFLKRAKRGECDELIQETPIFRVSSEQSSSKNIGSLKSDKLAEAQEEIKSAFSNTVFIGSNSSEAGKFEEMNDLISEDNFHMTRAQSTG